MPGLDDMLDYYRRSFSRQRERFYEPDPRDLPSYRAEPLVPTYKETWDEAGLSEEIEKRIREKQAREGWEMLPYEYQPPAEGEEPRIGRDMTPGEFERLKVEGSGRMDPELMPPTSPAGMLLEEPVSQLLADVLANQEGGDVGLAGLVLKGKRGAANARWILEQMMKLNPKSSTDLAMAYFKVKYPLLYKDIANRGWGGFLKVPPDELGGSLAGFNSDANLVRVADFGSLKQMDEYIKALVHEVTHGHDWWKTIRTPRPGKAGPLPGQPLSRVPVEQFLHEGATMKHPVTGATVYGSYKPGIGQAEVDAMEAAGKTKDEIKAEVDRRTLEYLTQPVEARAHTSMQTGVTTSDRFKRRLYKNDNPYDLDRGLTESIWRHDIRPALESRYTSLFNSGLDPADIMTMLQARKDVYDYVEGWLKRSETFRKS